MSKYGQQAKDKLTICPVVKHESVWSTFSSGYLLWFITRPGGNRVEISTPVFFCLFWGRGVVRMRHRVPKISVWAWVPQISRCELRWKIAGKVGYWCFLAFLVLFFRPCHIHYTNSSLLSRRWSILKQSPHAKLLLFKLGVLFSKRALLVR